MDPDRERTGLWEFGEKKSPLEGQGGNGRTAKNWILFFALCIVTLLCDINEQNAPVIN